MRRQNRKAAPVRAPNARTPKEAREPAKRHAQCHLLRRIFFSVRVRGRFMGASVLAWGFGPGPFF